MERETTNGAERVPAAKNKAIAKDAPAAPQQNGEVQPSRKAAAATPGTDEAKD